MATAGAKQVELVHYELKGINFAAINSGTIFTTEAGRLWITVDVIAYCTLAANVNTVATLSIGTNGANFDNVAPAYSMAGLDTTGEIVSILNRQLAAPSIIVPRSTAVSYNVSVAAGGIAPVQTGDIYVIGYYI